MAIDLVALKTALETDSRYDAAVRSGKNRELLALLNADEVGQTAFNVVPTEDVLDAIGDGVRGMTAAKLQTLRLFTNHPEVDFRKASVRAELLEIFSGNVVVRARISAIAQRDRTFAEGIAGEEVRLKDLWAVLKDIPKSYMATWLARG